ncbi:hypothetical protein A3F34_02805 [Candidatus Roizmanbacteria bacterium RIFCSPHIGHO2_12_FULL_44_10]|uniref:Glucose/Sorbosone dehydrogenase domain-containing protein n=1 Tax=Candidatus Roizmanbacteria bacterium RIFCSPHIGHO2_12_FULL_44_10 TaxID=1802054 RepID=A0A1F7I7S4_9BACT|nr:MAG: hypothetical protein A3F34_02805 [Candidatus Roizmanbacteria bacterium RIFCSPHIGHO2_12_FULL_44_10]
MKIRKYSLVILVVVLIIGLGIYWRGQKTHQVSPLQNIITKEIAQLKGDDEAVDYKVESFAENLFVPWEIVFTSERRILLTERDGKIRAIENGILRPDPLISFSEVSSKDEEGLMGLALDPHYSQNKLLYACLAYGNQPDMFDKVVVLEDKNSFIELKGAILDRIPAAEFHAGCRLGFGPDEKLYITTGDATKKELAQDLNSLAGKILRINTDGTIPTDNPFPNSPVYSLGHRNSQGIAWQPGSGLLVATEHGPTVFDGPPGGDEINIIKPGLNYGWPLVSHEKNREGLIAPKIIFTPAVAPAAAMFYSGTVFPQFKNNFLFGGLKGEGVFHVVFSAENPESIIEYERLPDINVGRVRAITEGPDGLIYFSTSNKDGRGSAKQGDDRIYRLVPKTSQ